MSVAHCLECIEDHTAGECSEEIDGKNFCYGILEPWTKNLLLFNVTDYRYELRIRYLPKSFHDMLAQDRVTFHYFYDQVKDDLQRSSNLTCYLFTSRRYRKYTVITIQGTMTR